MPTTRKPAAKKKSAAPDKKEAAPPQTDRRWSVLLFGLGAFFVLLAALPGESLWAAFRGNVYFGLFGFSGWFVGPVLLYWALRISLGKPLRLTVIKGLLLLVTLAGAAVVFGAGQPETPGFFEALKALHASGKTGFGGGLLGLITGWTLLKLTGPVAAQALTVLLLLLAVMLLTGLTPGDVVRFFSRLADRIVKTDEEEEFAENFEERQAPAPPWEEQPFVDAAPPLAGPAPGRRNRANIDIDLDTPVAEGEQSVLEEVYLGPGGALQGKGGRPLPQDDLLPFGDAMAGAGFEEEAAQGDILLFGADDPYASLGGPESRLRGVSQLDVEYIPVPEAAPEFDLFNTPAEEVQPGTGMLPRAPEEAAFENRREEAFLPAEAEGRQEVAADAGLFDGQEPRAAAVPAANPTVEQLIDKAAAVKTERAAADTRADDQVGYEPYHFPPLSLFAPSPADNSAGAKEEMRKTADLLVGTLASFGVNTRILDVSRGPSITRYEVQPQAGVKISRITNLADDIALNLAAGGVRIEAPIPGKPAVGIEVPNKIRSNVSIRSVFESAAFATSNSPLAIALGKDIAGECVVADLTRMPHLLIAGSTGSGKSVCINATIMSFLFRSSPEDVRLLLIDPKVVELAEYNGIPHLLMPVVTEPRKAASALGAAVAEMERRYHLFAENNVRDIRTFNKLAARKGDLEKLPHIAIVIDELADLMMTSGKEVEDYICRIAQKARAAGMHLIVATQRPSVDVITGLIKANIPSRVAFAVSSQVDSRTILDAAGAEKLVGNGDMLFMPVGANKPVRIQGTYVKDKEISEVLRFIKKDGAVRYDESMIEEMERRADAASAAESGAAEGGDDMINDPVFRNAVETALEAGQISTSFLQRRLKLGYARAGRIMDEMERLHIVSPPEGSKPRQVLIGRQQWLEMSMNAGQR